MSEKNEAALPTDPKARKDIPIVRGLLDYFPAALAEVANVSRVGNEQHNPGEPMHHARGKSTDHADCAVRHLMDRGTFDTDGLRHAAKAAWRALALLQEELEAAGAPLARGARLAPAETVEDECRRYLKEGGTYTEAAAKVARPAPVPHAVGLGFDANGSPVDEPSTVKTIHNESALEFIKLRDAAIEEAHANRGRVGEWCDVYDPGSGWSCNRKRGHAPDFHVGTFLPHYTRVEVWPAGPTEAHDPVGADLAPGTKGLRNG